MMTSSNQLFWSRSELRMAAWLHGVVLAVAALSLVLAMTQGMASMPLLWSAVPVTIMWLVSALMVSKRPALKLEADRVWWTGVLFPWHYQNRPRSQIKRLERTVVDGQIVRYVAHTHDGDELLLPTAPRLEHTADVAALDAFMQQHFADLLSIPRAGV